MAEQTITLEYDNVELTESALGSHLPKVNFVVLEHVEHSIWFRPLDLDQIRTPIPSVFLDIAIDFVMSKDFGDEEFDEDILLIEQDGDSYIVLTTCLDLGFNQGSSYVVAKENWFRTSYPKPELTTRQLESGATRSSYSVQLNRQ
jgi:hypothetical protein